jgi:site-specific DNA-methyltransferase (adenine-specific)
VVIDEQAGEDWRRYFYCPKASRSERNAGCEGLEAKISGMSNGAQLHGEGYGKGQDIGLNRVIARQNHHPTVKPVALMRWLIRLIAPPGGLVLDPFMGSGTTGVAAVQEGRDFVGIEREAEYHRIAEARIAEARIAHAEEQQLQLAI